MNCFDLCLFFEQTMRTTLIVFLAAFTLAGIHAREVSGLVQLFDDDWRFHRGGAQRAEQPEFDDSGWRKVDLPHDWSIEDLPGTQTPFDRDAISQVSGGFTTGGTGWYRKSFQVAEGSRDKQLFMRFDGVYMRAEVYLNGRRLGIHPYGYTSFEFDLTGFIKYGQQNVVAVKVMNEGENSRWYSGSGIYRHVWLITKDQVHIGRDGIFVTTPEVRDAVARVKINTRVENESNISLPVKLVATVLDPSGNVSVTANITQNLDSGSEFVFDQSLEVKSPRYWSTETPALYTAVIELFQNDIRLDREQVAFGIRTISFDADHGFLLNGKNFLLKGGCIHHDNGPLGAKSYDRAEERRVELLKASGFNAIRCAHNPPSPAFLDACDRLGMLVIDEAFDMWNQEKTPNDYHLFFNEWWQTDVESMILRDRNHPSVIMWSIGNEIPNRHKQEVVEIAGKLAAFIRNLDPTRPVTSAVNDLKPDKDPYFSTLDVAGYNYAAGGDHLQQNLYEQDHDRIPGRIMYGAESYPLEAFQSWMSVLDYPYVIGDFVWTAYDYIGEASIGWRGYWQEQDFFPWNLAFCGDIDICGWKRPQSFYRDALWKTDQLSVFVTPPVPSFVENPNRQSWSKWHWVDAVADWNWKGYENKSMTVSVYSSCERAELFLNGKSLGAKPTGRSTRYTASWEVPYEAGVVKAVGYNGRKVITTSELTTAAEPVQLKLLADKTGLGTGGQDLSYITVELTDASGNRNPKAENLVKFSLEGPGTIIGVGNANPVSLESYVLPQRKAWQGRCLVIVKAGKEPGKIVMKATADGLAAAEVELLVK